MCLWSYNLCFLQLVASKNTRKALGLVEVLLTVFIVSLIVIAFSGAFSFVYKAFGFSLMKTLAGELGQKELEYVKSLSYEDIGVVGGEPSGILARTEQVSFASRAFTIERDVQIIADSLDGLAYPQDQCPADYKQVKIKVSWDYPKPGSEVFWEIVSPKNIQEECQVQGGVLEIKALDTQGELVASVLLNIFDSLGQNLLSSVTLTSGSETLFLSPGEYKLEITKQGYSSERTYSTQEIARPENPNVLILDKGLTQKSMIIDLLSSLTINTFVRQSLNFFSDPFFDLSKTRSYTGVVLDQGRVILDLGSQITQGRIFSNGITPSSLVSWQKIRIGFDLPPSTIFKTRVWYLDSNSVWQIVPEQYLPGNQEGFSSSEIDISSLPPSVFSTISLEGILETTDGSTSPALDWWEVVWQESDSVPLSGVSFRLKGERLLGFDQQDQPVLRNIREGTTDASASFAFDDLEWDNYTAEILSSNLVLEDTDPALPLTVNPASSQTLNLYLAYSSGLSLAVKEQGTLEPVFGAKVRIYNQSLERTGFTNEQGEIAFALPSGDYTLEITSSGYSSYNSTVTVNGQESLIVELTRQE